MQSDGRAALAAPAHSGWAWLVPALAVLLSFPYYFSLNTFFSHDDFLILHFYKDWPVWKPWLYFQTDILSFYRPLQSYGIQWLLQTFGMTAFPFALVLVLAHLANVVLFGFLIDRLFRDRALTLLTVAFLATNWEYCDVVFWKANYGTALSWLSTLGAAHAFLEYLERRAWQAYAMTLFLVVAALLAKESAGNVPLLLTLVFWAHLVWRRTPAEGAEANAPRERSPAGATWRRFLADGARTLAPIYLLVGVYTIFHLLMVRDVYGPGQGYRYATPLGAIQSVLRGLTFWLLSPVEAAAELLRPGNRPAALLWLDRHVYVLPLLLIVLTAATRNRCLLFGLLWAVLAFVPNNLIFDPHTPRYYYSAISGAALLQAELVLLIDRALAVRGSARGRVWVRVSGITALALFAGLSLTLLTKIVREDAARCGQIREVYSYLATLRGRVPPRTTFCVLCLSPVDHFNEGLGLREMVKMALADDSVEAFLPGQPLTKALRERLRGENGPPVNLVRLADGRLQVLAPTGVAPAAGR